MEEIFRKLFKNDKKCRERGSQNTLDSIRYSDYFPFSRIVLKILNIDISTYI